MKILFLVPYPLKEAPSQRFRFEQYFEILASQGHTYEVKSFLTSYNGQLFYQRGNYFLKAMALIVGFGVRFRVLFSVRRFDFIFIHREATPLGPPIVEWIVFAVLKKKIIYDFDDAIWLTDKQNENPLTAALKWRSKVKSICRWSYRVSCGNEFLRDYAAQFNPKAVVNPTTINTLHLDHRQRNPAAKEPHALILGWTGSHSTLKYLHLLESVIQQLEEKYPRLQFMVVANKKPDLNLKSLVFKPWSISTEIEDLAKMDIGIMPLEDDPWSKGKCGFKALQYMALEIPTVASPVGVNVKIVKDGINGFLCGTATEWTEKLTLLIEDASLRIRLGKEARKTIEESYSVSSNTANFLSLFD